MISTGLDASYIAIVGCFLLSFMLYRIAIAILIKDILNNSCINKTVKGQNFWDWLFYRRFKDVLPKMWIANYYLVFILFFATMIACTILYHSGIDDRAPIIIYFLWFMISLFPHIEEFTGENNRKKNHKKHKKRLKRLKQQKKKQQNKK